LSWNWTKSGFTILHKLMLLMRIVWSFVWWKFSSVGKGEWWDELKYGQNLKLGDAHVTPRNIQEVQVSNLRDAPRHPLLHRQKYQVIFQDTIFLLLHMLCVFLGAYLFLLSVFFFLFAEINCCTLTYFFWRRHTPFSLPRTL
jgi:hypothetical protein